MPERRIQIRRGTLDDWNTADPVLGAGEPGVELEPTAIKLKIGDGETPWSELDYVTGSGGGGGAVDSVNGETGVVVLDADDVGAEATGTAAGAVAALAATLGDLATLDQITVDEIDATGTAGTSTYLGSDGSGNLRWGTPAGGGGGGNAADVTVAAYDEFVELLGTPPNDGVLDVVTWTGDDAQTWAEAVGAAINFDSALLEAHRDSTQAHGMPAPADRLLFRDANGRIPLAAASTPPGPGTNPASGFWLFGDASGNLVIRNSSGEDTYLSPPWRDEYVDLDSDHSGAPNTTLVDLFAPVNNLPANSTWTIDVPFNYTAAATTGRLKLGWSSPSDCSIDWTASGLAPAATAANGEHAHTHGTRTSNLTLGGAGATRIDGRVRGRIKMGATAGAPTLRYAQQDSSATVTVIKSGSYMLLHRVE